MRAYGRITDEQTSTVFGQIFIWWDIMWLHEGIPGDWDSRDRIDSLRAAITRATPAAEMRRWREPVERELAERLKSHSALAASITPPKPA
ncbi:hypothetical protein BJL95_04445 [Methylomonas sp. LWB]|nr:hypothetical protein BJL95_04445 [Methylomonas sp. LWB]